MEIIPDSHLERNVLKRGGASKILGELAVSRSIIDRINRINKITKEIHPVNSVNPVKLGI